jgi:hypothetical protein
LVRADDREKCWKIAMDREWEEFKQKMREVQDGCLQWLGTRAPNTGQMAIIAPR